MTPPRKQFVISRNDFQNAGYISSYIKKELKKAGIDKDVIRRVVIAAYEAEINVVIHSYGGMCEYVMDEESIRISFKDHGPGIEDIERAMEAGYSTATKDAQEHGFGAGMGLLNIRNSADDFSIRSSEKGTQVAIRIRLRKQP